MGPGGTAFPTSQLLMRAWPLPQHCWGGEGVQRVKAQGRGAAAAQWADEVRALHKVAIVQHTAAAGFCLTGSHLRPTAWHRDSTGAAGPRLLPTGAGRHMWTSSTVTWEIDYCFPQCSRGNLGRSSATVSQRSSHLHTSGSESPERHNAEHYGRQPLQSRNFIYGC